MPSGILGAVLLLRPFALQAGSPHQPASGSCIRGVASPLSAIPASTSWCARGWRQGPYTGNGRGDSRRHAQRGGHEVSVNTAFGGSADLPTRSSGLGGVLSRTTVHKTGVLTFAGDCGCGPSTKIGEDATQTSGGYQHVDTCTIHDHRPGQRSVIVTGNLFSDIIYRSGTTAGMYGDYRPASRASTRRASRRCSRPVHGSADHRQWGHRRPTAAIMSWRYCCPTLANTARLPGGPGRRRPDWPRTAANGLRQRCRRTVAAAGALVSKPGEQPNRHQRLSQPAGLTPHKAHAVG